jgi:phenylacetic acid degradation operon negative regulatory protein
MTISGTELDYVELDRAELVSETSDLAPGSARSRLITVLGELVWPTSRPAWTSSLLYVLGGLGVEERTARQTIARASSAGWIEPERRGREARWTLTPKLTRIFEEGAPRVASLSDPFLDWDGRWLVLLVTVPHDLRSTRKRLYGALDWAGFGNPTAGVWLSPHSERREQVAATIESLGLTASTMSFLGATDSVGISEADIVRKGWDLETLSARYAVVEEEFRDVRPAPGDETLFTHLRMLGALQRLPYSDPQLPEALLPDWIGRRVSTHLQSLRTDWAAGVHARWAEINAD